MSIPPLVIANLTPDPSEYGTRIGMGYTIAAIGALVGNPIAGAARRSAPTAQEEFQGTWYFAAAGMVVATLLMLWTRVGTKGWALNAKI